MSKPLVIAIDGPAASGKGTLARRLAESLGYAYLDTGRIYRAVAAKLLDQGVNADDFRNHEEDASGIAASLSDLDLEHPGLRTERVSIAASEVAAMPLVRQAVKQYQHRFAGNPPGNAPGAVLDGRDIGTVICPDAPIKIFVTASLDTRTARRASELRGRGEAVDEAALRDEMHRRDERDRFRDISPMKPAEDAHLLDTTNLDIEATFARAEEIVQKAMADGAGKAS